jgi:hypothetical protein
VSSSTIVYNYSSGNPNSLTGKNRKIEDLIRATAFISKNLVNEENKSQKEFDWIMIAKQSLTILKYGNSKNRIFAIQTLFHFLLSAPRKARQTIIRQLFRKII